MTKIVLVLWMLVDGQSTSPPDRYEMPSLDVCILTLDEKLNEAMEATDDIGTQYVAACIVDKSRDS